MASPFVVVLGFVGALVGFLIVWTTINKIVQIDTSNQEASDYYGVVRICYSGTRIYRDERNGRLYVNHPPQYLGSAPIAPGVGLDSICEGRP
jgi:hypothetical protein